MTFIPQKMTIVVPSAEVTAERGRVNQIKSIRAISKLGLKEAKDISDSPGQHTIDVSVESAIAVYSAYTHSMDAAINYKYAVRELQRFGVEVLTTDNFAATLEKMVVQTVMSGDYELAHDLLSVLKKNYPSR